MDNDALKEAARKELLRRAAKKELERRRAAKSEKAPAVAAAPEMSWAETGTDALKGAGSGLAKGVMSLGGALGDVQQMTGNIASWGAEKLGASPEVQQMASQVGQRIATPGIGQMPRTEQIQGAVEGVTGPMYEAKSMTGQIVDRMGQIAPAALAGPGSLARKGAMTVAPAVAGELASRIPGVEGSAYEPYVDAGASLAAGLGAASIKSGSPALKAMRDTAPDYETIAADTTAAYKAIDDAKVVFDSNAAKGTAMKIMSTLNKKGFDPVTGGEVAGLYKRVKSLTGAGKVAGWTQVDSILKDAKAILRSNATKTEKMQAGIVIDNLETLVKSGKVQSLRGVPREAIGPMVDKARELGGRKIRADQIIEMKGKLPGYLAGDESGSRNQFGSYLRNSKANGLSDAEKAAFSKVVRREGPLNAAHMGGSRLGQIASTQGGGAVGALIGSTLGPIGTGVGYVAGNVAGAGINIGMRKFMDKITEKAVDDALKTVLAGRKAQGVATSAAEQAKLKATIRATLSSEAASRPIREDWLVQDARGNTYSP